MTTTSLSSDSTTSRVGGPTAMLRFLILGLVMLALAVCELVFVTAASGSTLLPFILTGLGAALVIAGIVRGVRSRT